ncbi:paired mesoderm homeobox protein 2A-like [Ananas comosus]|uniref:Paired mesoderm homeobox protein 2A-like n=1 Tax=Ananas comosus TaxID=4615 RepID=A0A6P5E9H0_ANACO|nr:paired mesoderm homeobox protein 2A-like [Ananas comosus]
MASLSSPPPLPPAAAALRRSRRPAPIAAAANPAPAPLPSPEPTRRSPWWAPLFRPILGDVAGGGGGAAAAAERERGRLTAEKARVLRRETRATEGWHDAMYHSAIASRLASPDDLEV